MPTCEEVKWLLKNGGGLTFNCLDNPLESTPTTSNRQILNVIAVKSVLLLGGWSARCVLVLARALVVDTAPGKEGKCQDAISTSKKWQRNYDQEHQMLMWPKWDTTNRARV